MFSLNNKAATLSSDPIFWASSLDNLDIITWCPEIFMLIGITVLLIYSIHYGATLYIEVCGGTNKSLTMALGGFAAPSMRSAYPNSTALNILTAGPRDMISHLTQWCSIWLLLTIIVLITHPWEHSLLFSSLFLRSKFSAGLSIFLFAYALICIQLSSQWLSTARAARHVEYFIFILICLFGQHMLLQSIDLMSIYMSLELQSFCLAILCSLNYKSQFSVEAGIKYFLLSAFSSGIMLLGMSLIYWSTGLTNCTSIKELIFASYAFVNTKSMAVDLILMLGVWLVSLAFLWKLSAAPLHMWAADVYQGAWSSVTLILSTLPKVAVFGCWISVWHGIWHVLWPETMIFFSALSMFIGAIAAMGQVHMKRLLAYSSINHIGILLMALCSQGGSASALLIHLFLYLWTSLAVWGLILWPFKRVLYPNMVLTQYIWDFQILWKTQPLAAITWVIVMMSLAGLPPVAGFLGKLSVFWWTLNAHQYALLAIALLTTLLSSVYYLRVVRIMYIEAKPIKNWSSFTAMHTINAYLITISLFGLLAFLWYSSPLILYTHLICLVGA
uniref:NADH dehydrogenase subunit 2 n=1 Tax=Bulbochaete rectangularis var. hiloensis TaxID=55990 RepID=A0A6M4SQ37_9CHLO|nr:NADH dehydrogenase subunit 2 [Bulbochaete rectangularis var. hiloensis]